MSFWENGIRRFNATSHGGVGSEGRRKSQRPLSTNKPLHVVLSSARAQGRLNLRLPKNQYVVRQLITREARRFRIRLQSFSNFGNELHLIVKAPSRQNFQNFLRTISALIARQVTGAKKGRPFGRFWDHLAFSQVLKRARDQILFKKLIHLLAEQKTRQRGVMISWSEIIQRIETESG